MSRWKLRVNGRPMEVEVEESAAGHYVVRVNGEASRVVVEDADYGLVLKPALPPARPAAMPTLPPIEPPPAVSVAGKTMTSPMPGRVVKMLVSVGDSVGAGDGICILESMKMENTLTAPRGGRVTAIHVRQGGSTNTGSPIADIE
jgi:biotin carboxyl carrier protein